MRPRILPAWMAACTLVIVAAELQAGTFTKLNEGDPHPSWAVSRINNLGHVAMVKGTTSAYSGTAWLWTGSWSTLTSFPGSSVGNFTFRPRMELNDQDRIAYATGGDAVRVANTAGIITLGAAPTSLNYFIDINNNNRIAAYSWGATNANRIYGSDDPYTTYALEVGPTDIIVYCVSNNDSGQIAWRPSGTTKNIYLYTPGAGSAAIGSSDYSQFDLDNKGRIIHLRARNSVMLNNTRLRSSTAVWLSSSQYSQPRVSDNGRHVVWTEYDGAHWNLWTLVDGIPTDLTLGAYNEVLSPDVNNDGLIVFASATGIGLSPFLSDVYLYTTTDPEPIVYNGHFDGETLFRWEPAGVDLVARSGGGFAARLTAAPAASLEQAVDLPETPGTLRFDFDFASAGGTLTVALDGAVLAELGPEDDTETEYTHFEIPILSAPPLGTEGALLSFSLAGDSAIVFLDDIGFEPISTGVAAAPASAPGLFLGPAFPNPFAASTAIRYVLDGAGTIESAVYDLSGRRVGEPARKRTGAGTGVLTWDGRGASGELLPPGVYFLRTRSGADADTRKVILVR